MNLPSSVRIVAGLAVIAFIAWRLVARWQAASDYSEAMAREQQARRALHAQLLNHPAWHHLRQALAARGIHVVPQVAQDGTFHFGLLTLTTEKGPALRLDDPGVRWLTAYLKGPRKIVATVVLATGAVEVREAVFGEWPTDAF